MYIVLRHDSGELVGQALEPNGLEVVDGAVVCEQHANSNPDVQFDLYELVEVGHAVAKSAKFKPNKGK